MYDRPFKEKYVANRTGNNIKRTVNQLGWKNRKLDDLPGQFNNGSKTGTLTSYVQDSVTVQSKLVVINNSDKSGRIDSYEGTVLLYKATWTSTGV
jgi:hypothetical protein